MQDFYILHSGVLTLILAGEYLAPGRESSDSRVSATTKLVGELPNWGRAVATRAF